MLWRRAGLPARDACAAARASSSAASSSPAPPPPGPSPVQRVLLRHGVTPALLGPAFWSDPRLGARGEAWASDSLEPKLRALEGEGLPPEQVARFLRQPAPIPCDAGGFLANLGALRALLRPIGADRLAASDAWAPGLSAAGLLVVRAPACLGTYLGRPTGAIAAHAVWLGVHLGPAAAEQLADWVFRRPCILTATLGPPLLGALGALDDLAAAAARPAGWARRLLQSDPLVLTYTERTVGANLGALAEAGFPPEAACSALEAQPNLLVLDLAGPATRRLLAWVAEESQWPLADFGREPK